MINQYREAYKKLNSSYRKDELIYPLTNRGFFSEINNLALAVLYCIENKICLKIYSKNWVGGRWNEYFNPLFTEYNGIVPLPADLFVKRRKDSFYIFYHKYLMNRKMIQGEIWNQMSSKPFFEKHFDYPELGIKGGIFEAKKQILNLILDYNKKTAQEVFSINNIDLDFVKTSCGIHVRRGDKIRGKSKEADLFEIESYVNKILEVNSDIKKITICTDDYGVIKDFKEKYPEFSYLSLCEPNRIGYFQKEYNKIESEVKKRAEVINVLKDANLLINSKMFVGTYSSNIARFVALMRDDKNCYSLDIDWTPS
ncbi:hypothetical protein [Flavobacterium anhuiense]|uniref:hypothetical protein n=1 Tax=Flavobacterium anhuiense TaxID=459526 RepID=UPI003D99AF7A